MGEGKEDGCYETKKNQKKQCDHFSSDEEDVNFNKKSESTKRPSGVVFSLRLDFITSAR